MTSPLTKLGPIGLPGRAAPPSPPEKEGAELAPDRFTPSFQAALWLGLPLLAATPVLAQQVQVLREPWKQPGSLVLSDFFDSRDNHGEIVYQSARDSGFQGEIVRRQAYENAEIRWNRKLDAYLDQRQFTPQEMRDFLRRYSTSCQVGSLDSATQEIQALIEEGMSHSVFNLSRGCGSAQIVDALYARVRPALHPNGDAASVTALQRLRKIAPAFGMQAEEVIRSPAAFQQALIDWIDRPDSQVEAAQARYDAAVSRLEENHASVVVAAANSGELLEKMKADNGGLELRVSPTFWNNRLANPRVTTVGGLQNGKVARYSNPDPGVDVYADGDALADGRLINYGTSFATPRVGSLMARLHQEHPEWTSEQVEQELQRFAPAGQLDGQLAAEYLTTPLIGARGAATP